MAFDWVRLPTHVEVDAQSIVEFRTGVITLSNKEEVRNSEWSRHRRKFNISYGIDTVETYKEVIAFFYARQGKKRAFLFRDWSDFELIEEVQGLASEVLVDGVLQIRKTYTSGPSSYSFDITRPIISTIVVYVDGEVYSPSNYTYLSFGKIDFGAVIPVGTISISCEYDCIVRFDSDELPINIRAVYQAQQSAEQEGAYHKAIEIPDIVIVEIPDNAQYT